MEHIEELASTLELIQDVGTPERVRVADGKLIMHKELVVMTDSHGKIVSRYKDDTWLLKHAGASGNIFFSKFDPKSKDFMKRLILATLMHSNRVISNLENAKNKNFRGLNSAKMAYSHFSILSALYSRSERKSKTFYELLADKDVQKKCINVTPPSLCNGLKVVFEAIEHIGESVDIHFVLDKEIDILLTQKAMEHQGKQYSVIPIPIYAELFRQRWAHFEFIEPFIENFCKLIKNILNDRLYGRGSYLDENGKTIQSQMPFKKVTKIHKLVKLFSKYNVYNLHKLLKFITGFQITCAYILNQLSGMRTGEINKLTHKCFVKGTETKPSLLKGITSKKHNGVERPNEWITHSDVGRIVTLLEKLSSSILDGLTLDNPENIPLFIKPKYTREKERKADLHYVHNLRMYFRTQVELPLDNSAGQLILTQEYVETYLKTTELRPDYWDGPGTELIGQVWRPNFHQGRRTFSFLAINSGMVTASVLKEQLAQTSMMMAAYYGNGAANLDPLITNESYHIAKEIENMRDEQAMITLHTLILSGKKIDLKKEITDMDRDENDVIMRDATELVFDEKQTKRDIRKGNISIRGILTGWCSKLGVCQSNLMLMFSDCDECDYANHDIERINTNARVLETYVKERLEKGKTENDLEILDAKNKINFLNRVKNKKMKEKDDAR